MENLYIKMKLDESTKHIENTFSEMAKTRNKLLKLEQVGTASPDELVKELETYREKLHDYVSQSRLLLLEYELITLADFADKILKALSEFNILVPDYSKFNDAFSRFIAALKGRQQLDAQAAGRLMNHIKMGYYPTDPENLKHIKKFLIFPESCINLIDCCCGCGCALQKLAEGSNSLTYGVELDEARAEEARKRLYRIGKGSFFHSRISSEAFHLLFPLLLFSFPFYTI